MWNWQKLVFGEILREQNCETAHSFLFRKGEVAMGGDIKNMITQAFVDLAVLL